jgi:hypothetical protein
VAHHCRAFDHYEKRAKEFDTLLGQSHMVRARDHPSVDGPSGYRVSSTSADALAWKARWKVLSTAALSAIGRMGRDAVLGPTFWYHIDKVFGIQTVEGSFRKSSRVLREMLSSLQEDERRRRSLSQLAAEKELQAPRPYNLYCVFCKVGWACPTRVATCSCGRLVAGERRGSGSHRSDGESSSRPGLAPKPRGGFGGRRVVKRGR